MHKGGKRPKDVNKLAHELVHLSTEESRAAIPTREQISALMAKLGKKGGKIGGKRRLQTMSAEKRRQIARAAAKARWSKPRNQ